MKRSEYAAQMWTLLDKCESCLRHTAYMPGNMPDFSHFDNPKPAVSSNAPTKNNNNTSNNIQPVTATKPATPETRQIIRIATEISACRKCPIAAQTKNKVPGQGAIPAKIMVISFFTDDESEKTMYPMSGSILDQFSKWLGAINIKLQDVYVTNLIKCNPHQSGINKDFVENCLYHLDSEIKIIKPAVIMTLGSTVVSSLCQKYVDINTYHGQMLNYRGFQVFPTFHPQDVLSNPYLRKPVWEDLQKFKAIYNQILSEPGINFE